MEDTLNLILKKRRGLLKPCLLRGIGKHLNRNTAEENANQRKSEKILLSIL